MLCPEILNLEVIEKYKLKVVYKTGEIRLFDAADHLWGPVFEPLKNEEYFKLVFISFNTVEWPNGADFAPEFLYEQSVPIIE